VIRGADAFALMLTYLAGLALPEGNAAHVNWWLHTLALLAFLPLIPHTKHLHLAPQPGDGVPAPARLQPHTAARGRRGLRPRHPAKMSRASTPCRHSLASRCGAAAPSIDPDVQHRKVLNQRKSCLGFAVT